MLTGSIADVLADVVMPPTPCRPPHPPLPMVRPREGYVTIEVDSLKVVSSRLFHRPRVGGDLDTQQLS